ncbi:hypothetical protein [Neptuniibacter sp. 2_MG-2023]|uniref:hypothetical protein n=1 Tax=Neptuniibacter sp. 2_MG-2023 TaxID=3062671 RepID=UPI0026E135E3|nr:hypothetical protein [Neptuniibacter sp. 2_MG-2023]MDO6514052.1 hypothetical protein [Neptuniibacter sp. 2_MG-2023]
MIDITKNIAVICGGLLAFISTVYALRKFLRALRPIKITPSVYMSFTEQNSDSIKARIVNRSEETVYITQCNAKECKSLQRAIVTHLKNPFIKPSLYPCVWWGTKVYSLLGKQQYKLEAGETVELEHKLDFSLPIAGFCEHEFKIVLELSSGKKVLSNRLSVPAKWHISSFFSNA